MNPKTLPYSPPYEITPIIVDLVERLGEPLGHISATVDIPTPPQLHREMRIQVIQASLNIEGNTLSLSAGIHPIVADSVFHYEFYVTYRL